MAFAQSRLFYLDCGLMGNTVSNLLAMLQVKPIPT